MQYTELGWPEKDIQAYAHCYRALSATMKAFQALENLHQNAACALDYQTRPQYHAAMASLADLGTLLYEKMVRSAGVDTTKKS